MVPPSDRTGVAIHRDQRAARIEMKGAVAGIGDAVGRLHRQESGTVQSDVERAAGLIDRTGRQIVHRCPILGVVQGVIAEREVLRTRHRHQVSPGTASFRP